MSDYSPSYVEDIRGKDVASGLGSVSMRPAAPGPATPLPPSSIDTVELVRLYIAAEESAGGAGNKIVQCVSSTTNGGNVEVAYSLAWVGATLLGKRVLFVDASADLPRSATSARGGNHVAGNRLTDMALISGAAKKAVAKDANLFVATLQHERTGGDPVLAATQIRSLLEALRGDFDMIVIAPTAVLDQPLAAILTTFVDGTLLVVESGRARSRDAVKSVKLLQNSTSPLIGVVFWSHRGFLPRWLQRWI